MAEEQNYSDILSILEQLQNDTAGKKEKKVYRPVRKAPLHAQTEKPTLSELVGKAGQPAPKTPVPVQKPDQKPVAETPELLFSELAASLNSDKLSEKKAEESPLALQKTQDTQTPVKEQAPIPDIPVQEEPVTQELPELTKTQEFDLAKTNELGQWLDNVFSTTKPRPAEEYDSEKAELEATLEKNAPVRTAKKNAPAVCFRRVVIVALVVLLLSFGTVYFTARRILLGPSTLARDAFVCTCSRYGMTEWIPGLVLDSETIQQILQGQDKEIVRDENE